MVIFGVVIGEIGVDKNVWELRYYEQGRDLIVIAALFYITFYFFRL